MPTYPSTLSKPNSSGYSLDPKKNKEEFISEFGTRRQRKFVTSQVYVVQLRFDFKKKSEYDEFLKFLKYDIDYGSLWFVADWLLEEGFSEGEWVWKFVKINYNASGYSMGFSCTCLMGPRYSNIISDDYVELGIEGSFFDSATDFECEDLEYYRTFFFGTSSHLLECFDWNGSNWTLIGNPLSLASTIEKRSVRDISAMKKDHIAVINGSASCKLGMYKFDGTDFTLLGTETLPTPNYSTLVSKMARLSATRVAIYDGFSTDKKLVTWEFDYTTNTWAQLGSKYDLSALHNGGIASGQNDICCMGNNRIAFVIYEGAGTGSVKAKLYAFDFNGSTWSIVGNPLTIYDPVSNIGYFGISAISTTEIVLTNSNQVSPQAYDLRLTKFIFDGSDWTAGTPSTAYAGGGTNRVAVFDTDKVALLRADGSNYGLIASQFEGNTFVEKGNLLVNTAPASGGQPITAYFEIE